MNRQPGPDDASTTPERATRAEFGFPVALFALGVTTLWQARGIASGAAGAAVGPQVFPYAVGSLLLGCAAVLVVPLVRGRGGQAEGGEDVDPQTGTDWATVAKLTGAFAALVVLVEPLGWPLGATLLFGGTAWALGARPIWRPLVVGALLGLVTHLLFTGLLGLYLPAGPLDGVLGG